MAHKPCLPAESQLLWQSTRVLVLHNGRVSCRVLGHAAVHLLVAPQRLQRHAVVRIPEEIELLHFAVAQVQEAHVVPAKNTGPAMHPTRDTAGGHGGAQQRPLVAEYAAPMRAVVKLTGDKLLQDGQHDGTVRVSCCLAHSKTDRWGLPTRTSSPSAQPPGAPGAWVI